MGNLAALKAKLRVIGYDGDEDMVVGGVIAAGVIVHLTVADLHIDYVGCAEFENSLVWRSSFQDEAIH